MGDNLKRKCFKCGLSPRDDPDLRLYRFPKPGSTNVKRCEIWTKFCLPDSSWSSVDFQQKLYSEHKMLCDKHFDESQFLNINEKKMAKDAVPCIDKGSSQSTSQIKDRPSTAKRKCDETKDWPSTAKRKLDETKDRLSAAKRKGVDETDDVTFNDIDINDQQNDDSVESEPDNNYFAIDHEVILDDFDNTFDLTTDDKKEDVDVEVTGEIQYDKDTPVHSNFKCNVCLESIVGFRYSCVQCVDWDMCAACEARGEHPAHFVLRVPAPTPHLDCEPVIAAIREQIQNLLQLRKEIKSEIYFKEETDVDAITEDFDPDLTDPILVGNDRSVPELSMLQERSGVDDLNTKNPSRDTETEGDIRTLDNSEQLGALRNFLVKGSTNSGRKRIRIRFKANQGKCSRHKVNQSLKQIIESVTNSHVIMQRENDDNR